MSQNLLSAAVVIGSHCMLDNFAFFVWSCFKKSTFLKNSFKNTIRVSNSLDPDQAGPMVRPDLGPNCLQRISTSDNNQ